MENKLKNSFSGICLYSLFFIGNTIINLPLKEYTKGSIIGFLVAFLLGFIVILRLNSISFNPKNSFTAKTIYLFLCLYSLLCGIVTLRNFVTFSDRIILPEISGFFPTLLFLILVWFLCRKDEKVILKLSFISFIAISVMVILLFVFSLKFLSFDFLNEKMPTLKEIGYQSLAYFSMSFIQSVIIFGFLKKEKSSLLGGYIIGGAFLFLTLIQCVATFGFSSLNNLLNPYSSAVGIITFGDKFSRLEGFSYFIYFACTLFKTVIALKSAKNFFGATFKRCEKFFLPVSLLVYLLISVFTNIFINIPFITIAPFLCIPPIIFLLLPKKLYS
ncbi:MAG: hypothetical protein E7565_05355 [Ruminococcaceae bacterium]|nr:hypothetical protein [Oscillospiraceae bacterium]